MKQGGALKQRGLVSPPLALLHLCCLSCQTPPTKRKQKKGFALLSFSFPFILAANPFRFCLSRHTREAPLADRQTAVRQAQPQRCQAFVQGEAGQVETQHKAQRQINRCTQWGFFSSSLSLSVFCFLLFFTWLVILSRRAAEGNKAACQADCQTGSNNLLLLETEVVIKQL